jgi:hypothetical protein
MSKPVMKRSLSCSWLKQPIIEVFRTLKGPFNLNQIFNVLRGQDPKDSDKPKRWSFLDLEMLQGTLNEMVIEETLMLMKFDMGSVYYALPENTSHHCIDPWFKGKYCTGTLEVIQAV